MSTETHHSDGTTDADVETDEDVIEVEIDGQYTKELDENQLEREAAWEIRRERVELEWIARHWVIALDSDDPDIPPIRTTALPGFAYLAKDKADAAIIPVPWTVADHIDQF